MPSTLLSQDQYAVIHQPGVALVNAQGKTVDGLGRTRRARAPTPAGGLGRRVLEPVRWLQPGTITAHEAVAKDMKIVMAPANHAYLDHEVRVRRADVNVPPTLGLHWACNTRL